MPRIMRGSPIQTTNFAKAPPERLWDFDGLRAVASARSQPDAHFFRCPAPAWEPVNPIDSAARCMMSHGLISCR